MTPYNLHILVEIWREVPEIMANATEKGYYKQNLTP